MAGLVTFCFINSESSEGREVEYLNEKYLKMYTLDNNKPEDMVASATMVICYDETKNELARYEESAFNTSLFDVYKDCGSATRIELAYGYKVNIRITVKTDDEKEIIEAQCYNCQTVNSIYNEHVSSDIGTLTAWGGSNSDDQYISKFSDIFGSIYITFVHDRVNQITYPVENR
ncbi:hypothetical protein BX667DRAFT_393906 [Coemansia mojavensis]|nr:hypothetical protein BX667DRAFT_220639 [Coemansia mojavensis]KAI9472979.1 hypothetical protein BX667DRAFT_393906 [Coemansia mojavensis]